MTNLADINSLEADRIHRAIFKKAIPDRLLSRYIEASMVLFNTTHLEQDRKYRIMLNKGVDLEALELAGRFTGKVRSLSAKFQLMVYLAETLPEYQDYYVNNQSSWFDGISVIIGGVLRSIYKLIKGIYIMWRIGDA